MKRTGEKRLSNWKGEVLSAIFFITIIFCGNNLTQSFRRIVVLLQLGQFLRVGSLAKSVS